MATLNVGSDQTYKTLADALAAANDGDVIVLNGDITESSVKIEKSVTIDLNNNTLTGKVYIWESAAVEIKNGKMTVAGTSPNFNDAVITTGLYTDAEGNVKSSGGASSLVLTNVDLNGGEAVNSRYYTNGICYKSTGGLKIVDSTITAGTATRNADCENIGSNSSTATAVYAPGGSAGDIVIENSTITGGYGKTDAEYTGYVSQLFSPGGSAVSLHGSSDVTITGSTVKGGSSNWYNAAEAINVSNQFSGTLSVVESNVAGGDAEGEVAGYGTGGVGLYTSMSTSCEKVEIEGSTISGGNGGNSWNGNGIEYRNEKIEMTITNTTVEAGNGENASGNGAALSIYNSNSTQVTLDDVKLNGEGNGSNTVIKGGDKGINLAGPVEIVGGELTNTNVNVDAEGFDGTEAIISGAAGEGVNVNIEGNENAVVVVEGGKTYITTETSPSDADMNKVFVSDKWADKAENEMVGLGAFYGVNAYSDINEAEGIAEESKAELVIAEGADVTYTKDPSYFLNTNPNTGGEENAFDNVVDAAETYDLTVNGTLKAYQILLNNAETVVSTTGKLLATGEAFRVMGGTIEVNGNRAADAAAPAKDEVFSGSWGGGVKAGSETQIQGGYFMINQEAVAKFNDTVIFVAAGVFNIDNADADFSNTYIYCGSVGTYQDIQMQFTNGADVAFTANSTVINDEEFGMHITVDATSTLTLSADSKINASTLTVAEGGEFIIDAADFEGFKKVVDLSGETSLEGKVTIANGDDVSVIYGADGDVTLVNVDTSVLYVDATFEGEYGEEIEAGKFFGINAFATTQDAYKAARNIGGEITIDLTGAGAETLDGTVGLGNAGKDGVYTITGGDINTTSYGLSFANTNTTVNVKDATFKIAKIYVANAGGKFNVDNSVIGSAYYSGNNGGWATAGNGSYTINNSIFGINFSNFTAEELASMPRSASALKEAIAAGTADYVAAGANNSGYHFGTAGQADITDSTMMTTWISLIDRAEMNLDNSVLYYGGGVSIGAGQIDSSYSSSGEYNSNEIGWDAQIWWNPPLSSAEGFREGEVATMNVVDSIVRNIGGGNGNDGGHFQVGGSFINGYDKTITGECAGVLNIINSDFSTSVYDNDGNVIAKDYDMLVVKSNGVVNVTDSKLTTSKLINDGTFTVAGESTLNIAALSGNTIDLLDGAIVKDSTVGGEVFVAGNVTFRGDNTFNMISDFGVLTDYYGTTAPMKWTVEAGASVTLTAKARYGLGYGDDVTINGSIADAKAARAALTDDNIENDVKCSFFTHGITTMESAGWNKTSYFTVNNAYAVIGSNNSFGNKDGNYGGTYYMDFNNAVIDISRFSLYEANSVSYYTFTDSDVYVGGAFMTADADSVVTLENTNISVNGNGNDVSNTNAGTLNVIDKSNLTYNGQNFVNNGTVLIENSSFTAGSFTNNGTFNVSGSNVSIGSLTAGDNFTVTGESTLDITAVSGVVKVLDGAVITDSYIGGEVHVISGENTWTGSNEITGDFSVGYNNYGGDITTNITGEFTSTNMLSWNTNGYKTVINIGTADGERTVFNGGQIGEFENTEINIVNTDLTYHYTFIRGNFNVKDSTFTQKNDGVNTYVAGNAKVVFDNSEWTLGTYSNIGSYGDYNYGNADVTLNNSVMTALGNLGIEAASGKTVKLTVNNSTVNVTTQLNVSAGAEVYLNDGAVVVTPAFNNNGTVYMTGAVTTSVITNNGTVELNGDVTLDAGAISGNAAVDTDDDAALNVVNYTFVEGAELINADIELDNVASVNGNLVDEVAGKYVFADGNGVYTLNKVDGNIIVNAWTVEDLTVTVDSVVQTENEYEFVFTATAEGATSYTFVINGQEFVSDTNTFTWTNDAYASELPADFTYYVVAAGKDELDNDTYGKSAEADFAIIDYTDPVIGTVALDPVEEQMFLEFTVADNRGVEKVELWIDGEMVDDTIAFTDGKCSVDVTLYAGKEYQFIVKDAAGNETASDKAVLPENVIAPEDGEDVVIVPGETAVSGTIENSTDSQLNVGSGSTLEVIGDIINTNDSSSNIVLNTNTGLNVSGSVDANSNLFVSSDANVELNNFNGTAEGDDIYIGKDSVANFAAVDMKDGYDTAYIAGGVEFTADSVSNLDSLNIAAEGKVVVKNAWDVAGTDDAVIKVGSYASFEAGSITGDSVNLTLNRNANAVIGNANINKLTVQAGAMLKVGKVTATAEDNVFSMAGSTAVINGIDFGDGNDTLTLSSGANLILTGAIDGLERISANRSATIFVADTAAKDALAQISGYKESIVDIVDYQSGIVAGDNFIIGDDKADLFVLSGEETLTIDGVASENISYFSLADKTWLTATDNFSFNAADVSLVKVESVDDYKATLIA